MDEANTIQAPAPEKGPTKVQIAILPNSTHLTVTLGMEVLRYANVVSGRQLVEQSILSTDLDPIILSDGGHMVPEMTIAEAPRPDVAIVIGGHPPSEELIRPYSNWLRKLSRTGTLLVGVDWGVVVLAESGLLEGHRVASHWEVAARLSEYQGTFSVTEDLYCFEGNRVTCAGLCAILDMMLHLVGRLHGDSVAKAICQDLIYSNPRPAETPQRLSPGLTSTPNDPRIVKCLARIEASPATPVPIAVLADMLGLSQRHLQKLAQRELGISLADYSLFHRLSKARDLALHTNMTMLEIAVATGFSSASVFARAFKNRYGQSASTYRNTYRQARARPFAVNSRL